MEILKIIFHPNLWDLCIKWFKYNYNITYFFYRTTEPISKKHFKRTWQNHPWIKVTKVCRNEGSWPFPSGGNSEIAPEVMVQFQHNLIQSILVWRKFPFVQLKDHICCVFQPCRDAIFTRLDRYSNTIFTLSGLTIIFLVCTSDKWKENKKFRKYLNM